MGRSTACPRPPTADRHPDPPPHPPHGPSTSFPGAAARRPSPRPTPPPPPLALNRTPVLILPKPTEAPPERGTKVVQRLRTVTGARSGPQPLQRRPRHRQVRVR